MKDLSKVQVKTDSVLAEALFVQESKTLAELRIKERFLSRKQVMDNKFAYPLAQIHGTIKEQEQYVSFLEEISKEK